MKGMVFAFKKSLKIVDACLPIWEIVLHTVRTKKQAQIKMKTNTLLAAAAILAVGGLAAQAQV